MKRSHEGKSQISFLPIVIQNSFGKVHSGPAPGLIAGVATEIQQIVATA